jgi:hypothetical protein
LALWVLWALKVRKDLMVPRVSSVLQVLQALMGQLELKELEEKLVLKGKRVILAYKVLRVKQENKDYEVNRVSVAYRVSKVF